MKLSKLLAIFLVVTTAALQAQSIGVKTDTPLATLDVNGSVAYREGTPLSIVNGTNNNVTVDSMSFYRIVAPTAVFSITGFSSGFDGRLLTIINATNYTMTLKHQNASSTAANRINTGGSDLTVSANGVVNLYYNTALANWVVTSSQGAPPNLTTINNGNLGDSLITIINGILGRVPPQPYIENYAWGLDGNTGTTAGTHFLGTTDAQAMVIKTNNTERARISSTGYVGINNSTPTYRLHIEDPSGSDADILSRVYNNGVITGVPGLLLQTASGTKAAPISMPSGGQLGVIRWGGYDGSAFNDTWCAEIAAMATQNWTTSAHGTGMWFRTIQNDSILSRARMVITHNGFVGLGFDSYTPQYKLDIDAISGGTGNPLRLLGLNAGATSDSIISSSAGILRRLSVNQVIANAWNITGNSGTVDGTNYIGTSDNIPLSIRVNNQKAGRIDHLQSNAFWGYQAGNAVTTGSYNTAIGQSALAALTQGVANLGVGTSALAALTTGSDNTAVGSSTLATMTTGNSNVAIGNQSGLSNTTGVRNVSIGYQSARNGTHSNSIMIGYQAGLQNAASNNVFIGSLSGPLTSTGSDNIGLGYYTLFQNQTGKNNIGIGSFALSTTTAAWGNTAIGHMSSTSIQTGQANTALGDSSLMNNVLGSNNTHIGYRAGLWTTGSNNIAIGYNATLPVTTADNQLALGTWLYGTNSNLGINTTTPQYKLDIDAKTGSAGNPLRLQGLQAGVTSDSIISSNAGVLRRLSIDQIVGASGWGLTGNSGTNPSTNFIGTTDEQDLVFKTNYTEAMRIVNGINYIGVGTSSPFTILSNHTGNIVDFSGRGSNQNSTILWNSTGHAYGMIVNNADVTGTGSAIMAKINSTDQAAFGLMVNVAGTDAFVVNGSANVGINKGIPEYKLDIDAQTGSAGNPLRLLGLNAGSTGDSIISSSGGILRRLSIAQVVGSGAWSTLGNAGTVDGTNFIGTTDNIPFNIRVNNFKAGRIDHLNSNAFFGFMSGNSNTGTFNSFFGHQAGSTNSTGSYNTGLGYGAMGTNTTASNNVAIGAGSMESNTTGYDNVAIGRHSMRKNITTYHNTAVGTYSLQENLGGYSNTAVGWSALNQTTTGYLNTATGAQALIYNITGFENVASGFQSMYFNTAGNRNTSIGTYAMFKNETGDNNVALGALALSANITGWGNTAVGYRAAISSVNGQSNVAVGDSALYNNTVSNNTAIGYRAGMMNTTGTNNTYLGYLAEASANNLSNATAIGANAVVGASNSLVLGGTGANAVNVGIGVTTPSVKLHQDNGNATATYHKFTAGTTTGQTSSDGFDVGVDASGNAVLNQKEALPLIMSANNAEVMRVTSAGNVLIGGNLTPGEVTGVALVNQSASDQKDDMTVTTYNSTTTPAFVIFKARGTAAAPTSLANSEYMGGFNANGYTGSAFRPLTAVSSITASDFTTSQGAELAFSTARSGTNSERMRINSTGNVGIATTTPNSTFEVVGSVAAAITTTSTNITLNATHYTVICTGGTPVITLPAASTCARRIYVIVNQINGIRTISSYIDFTGAASTSINNRSAVTVQSNGTNWYRIQ